MIGVAVFTIRRARNWHRVGFILPGVCSPSLTPIVGGEE